MRNGIKPIYFIGEPKNSFNQDTALKLQIVNVLDNISAQAREEMIIVYEPEINIGSNNIIDKKVLEEKIYFIEHLINDRYNLSIPIIYGGSITKEDIKTLKEVKELDGFILGQSSLDAANVITIYNNYSN